MTNAAILVSPAPVDGYPPVQHQARLLAEAGFRVELLSVAMPWAENRIEFTFPGVSIDCCKTTPGRSGAARRLSCFIAKLTALRLKYWKGPCVEIAYDPLGLLISDMAACRPSSRIAHFHECLQQFDTAWLEHRVKKAISRYPLVVVPDDDRASVLMSQLDLREKPVVVPNYPIADANAPSATDRPATHPLKVIYSGSLGLQQKLDRIIESVAHWQDETQFLIVGNDRSRIAQKLKALAKELDLAHRITFAGWQNYREIPDVLARADLGISLLDPSFEQWRTALGASNKRYEYMRAGLPQIGDMNPGVDELIEQQGIGRCLAAHDPLEIAKLVNEYAANPARRIAEGKRARALHLQKYNYQTAFQPVLDWIERSTNVWAGTQ